MEYLHDGRSVRVQARREVVLAAGAYHSPQLLMLSGVGRATDLEAHDVPVHCDLPGVGMNLSNHGSLAMRFAASRPLPALQALRLDRAALSAFAWAVLGRGFFTLQPTSHHLMLRTRPGLDMPDCQVTLGTLGIDADWWLPQFKPRVPHAFVANMTLLRPAGRGWVRLASADPLAAPRVLTNLFADAADRAAVCNCVNIVRTLFSREALAQWTRREWLPGDAVQGDAQIEEWLRRAASASGHPVGTCRMGNDANAVVDPQLRVRGVANLRVIDASVMPSLPGAGTYATTLMIAERGADLLRGQVLAPAAANVVPFPRRPAMH